MPVRLDNPFTYIRLGITPPLPSPCTPLFSLPFGEKPPTAQHLFPNRYNPNPSPQPASLSARTLFFFLAIPGECNWMLRRTHKNQACYNHCFRWRCPHRCWRLFDVARHKTREFLLSTFDKSSKGRPLDKRQSRFVRLEDVFVVTPSFSWKEETCFYRILFQDFFLYVVSDLLSSRCCLRCQPKKRWRHFVAICIWLLNLFSVCFILHLILSN